jgi:hypothetical protein
MEPSLSVESSLPEEVFENILAQLKQPRLQVPMRSVSSAFDRIVRPIILKKIVALEGLSQPLTTFFTIGPPLVDFFRQARQILQTQPVEAILMIWRLPSSQGEKVFVLPAFKVSSSKFFLPIENGVFIILEPNILIIQQLEDSLELSGTPTAVDAYEIIFEIFMDYEDLDPLQIRLLTADIQAGKFLAPFKEEVMIVESLGELETFLEAMASISEAVYEESKILLEVWPFERSSSTPQ